MSCGAWPQGSFQTQHFCDPPAPPQLKGYWNSSSCSLAGIRLLMYPARARGKVCRVLQPITPRMLMICSFLLSFCLFLSFNLTSLVDVPQSYFLVQTDLAKLFNYRNSGHYFSVSLQFFVLNHANLLPLLAPLHEYSEMDLDH